MQSVHSVSGATFQAHEKMGCVHLDRANLAAGTIQSYFDSGNAVVCLHNDQRINQILDFFLRKRGDALRFWEQNIFSIAENHVPGNVTFGDTLRFERVRFGHLCRKFCFYKDPITEQFVLYPSTYFRTGQLAFLDNNILELIWSLADDILRSAFQDKHYIEDYAVKIELLKYADSAESLERVFSLVDDSGSRWSHVGKTLDYAVADACGLFDTRYVRHLYALLTLLPFVGKLFLSVNDFFRNSAYYRVPNDQLLVGSPHTDKSRFITMLTGDRQSMTTEFFADGQWCKVPVERGLLSIFPNEPYAQLTGAQATIHRYMVERQSRDSTHISPNVTLSIGLISRMQVQDLP